MLSVAIVGFGPRGLSIIEKLISKKLAGKITKKLHIVIFDPYSLGFGCHDPKQPANMLANTFSSQMSIFCDESVCLNEFFIKGPSFYEFLIAKGIKAQKMAITQGHCLVNICSILLTLLKSHVQMI